MTELLPDLWTDVRPAYATACTCSSVFMIPGGPDVCITLFGVERHVRYIAKRQTAHARRSHHIRASAQGFPGSPVLRSIHLW